MLKPPARDVIVGPYVALPDDLAATCPILAEHLTRRFYDTDPPTPRETSTLLIFAQEGVWKACLRDRTAKRALWVSSAVYGELMAVLESALNDEHAVWREDSGSADNVSRRVKPGGKT